MWPAALRGHHLPGQAQAVDRPLEVDVEDDLHVLQRLVQQEAEPAAAGDVEQIVDAAKGLQRVLHQRLPIVGRADVQPVQPQAIAGTEGGAQAGLVDVGQGQPEVVARSQHAGPVLANAAGRAGDDGDVGLPILAWASI